MRRAGAMSVGESQGGLPPDAIVEKEVDALKEMQRLVERWHDASFGAMLRVVLAPLLAVHGIRRPDAGIP